MVLLGAIKNIHIQLCIASLQILIRPKLLTIPGLEPGTFSTSRRRDDRYTIPSVDGQYGGRTHDLGFTVLGGILDPRSDQLS